MKILKLSISGYRSLLDSTWTPGDLNLVIGPNGSGKSNLLKCLGLLSLSARGQLGKQVQREGGMGALAWDGRVDTVKFQLDTTPLNTDQSGRDYLSYILQMARLGSSSAYRIEAERLSKTRQIKSFHFLERDPHNAVIFDQQQRKLAALPETVLEEETLLSLAAGPFTANPFITEFQQSLAGWRIYQDFQTHEEAPVRQMALARLETTIEPDGGNLVPVLHTLYTGNREFKRDLDGAMLAAFGGDFEELVFPPAADARIQLRVRWSSLQREQTTADLSDGTLRFLFLIAVLANPTPPALIAIDEPETGLHPSMMPIVAEYAAEAATRTQVILTTHSAEFLNNFQQLAPTTTIARWEAGQTHLQVVDRDTLDYWLKEYTLGRLFLSGELEEMG